jgi:nicotinamidase-related amidase
MNSPANSQVAVLAIHFQNDVIHSEGRVALGLARQPTLRTKLIGAAGRLMAAARTYGVPVISIRIAFAAGHVDAPCHIPLFGHVKEAGAMVEGEWGTEFFQGFAPARGERIITHNRVNAFHGTPLQKILNGRKIETLVFAGVSTNSSVEHSVRHAADLGYRIVVAEDACASGRADLHAAALDNIRFLGAVSPVDEIVGQWSGPC